MGIGQLGIDGERGIEVRHRRLDLPLVAQAIAQVVQRLGIIRIQA